VIRDCTASPELCLAQNCFGYGNWAAHYWFIGLGEGLGGTLGSLDKRHRAFHRHECDGLSDCRDFHISIEEYRWHENPAKLQQTWSKLLVLLLDTPSTDIRRSYQKDMWGRAEGETCVAEIFGCPAQALGPNQDSALTRRRMDRLYNEIGDRQPQFVVIYGAAQRAYWEEHFPSSKAIPRYGRNEEMHVLGQTVVAFTLHPTAKGIGNQYWLDWGNRLRAEVAKARSRTA